MVGNYYYWWEIIPRNYKGLKLPITYIGLKINISKYIKPFILALACCTNYFIKHKQVQFKFLILLQR